MRLRAHRRPVIALCAALASFAASAFGQSNAATEAFRPSDGWKTAESIRLSEDGSRFEAVDSPDGDILYTDGEHGDEAGFLFTRQYFGDSKLSLEFMVPEGSEAAFFILGRYEIKLAATDPDAGPSADSAGAIAGGFNRNTDTPFAATPPLVNAARPAGEWQTLELRFRALRNDAAFNKIAPAFLLEAKLNGEVVQRAQAIEYYTPGSNQEWETDRDPHGIRGANGPIAIRNAQFGHADYDAVPVTDEGEAEGLEELVDHVEMGKEVFTGLGCIECHATKKGDTSFKTGPNLYGLFTRSPRQRGIIEQGDTSPFFVEADRNYLRRSLREPASELAIAESGPNAGEPYLPVMAPYNEQLISDVQADAVYSYLRTLNDAENRGAMEVLVAKDGPKQYEPLADTMLLLVDDRTRLQRGSMAELSGRAIHVGLPNGVNYSFDPRTLGIQKLWQGGFLDGSGEWQNRGGGGFAAGFDSKEILLGAGGPLIAPLLSNGKPIDFSFKEAKFRDWDTIRASLYSEDDHLVKLAAIDANFRGYSLDSTRKDAPPVFKFRVEDNDLEMSLSISNEGEVAIALQGSLASAQRFTLNTDLLHNLEPSAGAIDEQGRWTLLATRALDATLRAKLRVASQVWRPESSDFDHLQQPIVTEATEAQLPAGYRSEQYLPPKDNYGRTLLFEPTGIDVAPDGTIVVATRTSGIWRIVDGEWRLFAEGLFDSLGVVVEDESGLQLVVGQKPELTRVTDTNGDGLADAFETLADAFSFHSNYHSYMHGPVRDEEGNYYFSLNLLHTDEAIYKAEGLYMGTSGGFSGWTIKVTPKGEFIPWASGLRSPAGIAVAPDGRIWYSENQGEFVGTSKLFILKENAYYGHPSALVDLPGMGPDSPEIQWPASAAGREPAVALFPHNKVANAPGNPAWDTTEGRFGPFAGQMFIGDQTQSRLFRVSIDSHDGQERGSVIPFAGNLQSGIMRPVFLLDGSLLLGQTGRGWQARGGQIASLQRIVWDGETIAPAIHSVAQEGNRFTFRLTRPLAPEADSEQLLASASIASWTYRDGPEYGSPELDPIDEKIESVSISSDRMSFAISLEPRPQEAIPYQTARVYHARFAAGGLFEGSAPEMLEAYITSQ